MGSAVKNHGNSIRTAETERTLCKCGYFGSLGCPKVWATQVGIVLKIVEIVSSITNVLCKICAIFLAALVPTLKPKIEKTTFFAAFPYFYPFKELGKRLFFKM